MTVTLRQTHPDDWDGSLGGHGDETLTREPWPYECACGADYGPDIAKAGYPAWHQPNIRTNRFLDECSVESCHGKRVCHECSTRCKICGRLFCPDCTTEDIKTFGLCENCIGVYSEIEAGPIREKLIEVECRLGGQYSNQGYYRSHGMDEDLTKVLEIAKTALVRDDVRAELKNALEEYDGCEINPSNYRHDDVCHLNDNYVGLFQAVERAIGKDK